MARRLLLDSVSVSATAIVLTMLTLFLRPSITAIAVDGNGFGGGGGNSGDNQLLFNPYNQYTVDQLLIKMPSVLEEPELADSEISAKILDPPKSDNDNNNQNIFKLHLKSLLDSLSSNNDHQQNDTSGSVEEKSFTTVSPNAEPYYESTTQMENLFENLNDFQAKFNRKSDALMNSLQVEEHRKRQQEVNLVAQSRYRSVKHILSQIHFNCTGREEGYYADPDFDCHIFHYCKENGFKFTFICPANSVFSQEELQCESTQNPINSRNLCRSSEDFYFINSLIYNKNHSLNSVSSANSLEKFSGFLQQKAMKKLKITPSFDDFPVVEDKEKNKEKDKEPEDKVSSESSPMSSHLSSSTGSKWNGIDLAPTSNPKKIFKDSVIYTPKGEFPGFRPLFPGTTQPPLVQQIDTPRWFPPVNASSDILNKFDKNGFNVYNSQNILDKSKKDKKDDNTKQNILSSTTPTSSIPNTTTTPTNEIRDKKENKYTHVNTHSTHVTKRPFQKFKDLGNRKPPKRNKVPTGNGNSGKVPKMKPAYSIQWDDDKEGDNEMLTDMMLTGNGNRRKPDMEMTDDRKPASSNLAHITVRPSNNNNNDNFNYLFQDPNNNNLQNMLLDNSPPGVGDFSPIEFDEIFNKIPLRPLQSPPPHSGNGHGSPDQAYQHMIEHLRGQHRPPPRVLAAMARDQLKPLRMMINNFLVSGPGNSIAKRQFLITPPGHARPFVPSAVETGSGGNNKLLKRSDRYMFGPPMVAQPEFAREVQRPKRRYLVVEKLKQFWRPIARRFNL